jgi:endonuclease/exonuclease/phosphatase (EEP) superfamily protein YafD
VADPEPSPYHGARRLLPRAIAFATLGTWLALLAGIFGEYGWLLDLLAHFRIHYIVAFAALACIALLRRTRLVALAAAAGLVVSAAPLTAYLKPIAESSAAQPGSLKLVSLNVRYRTQDLARAAAYLEQTEADVLVLQEVTRSQAEQLDAMLVSYPYRSVDVDWRGAAIYSRWRLLDAQWTSLEERASRGAYVEIEWRGSRIALLGVHLHWPMSPREARIRDRQLRRVAAFAARTRGPLIVAGDFNITPWSPRFRRAVADSGLRDCGLGQGIAPSWPSQAIWLGIRIDHCLASPHWRVLDLRVGPHVGSDHRPVIVELAFESVQSARAALRMM